MSADAGNVGNNMKNKYIDDGNDSDGNDSDGKSGLSGLQKISALRKCQPRLIR